MKATTTPRDSHDDDQDGEELRTFQAAGAYGVLKDFPLSKERDDRLTVSLARVQRQAIAILQRNERVPQVRAFCWTTWRGLGQIRVLPDACAIITAHKDVQLAGGDMEPFEGWNPRPPDWGGLRRCSMNNVPPALAGKCKDIAEGLGMDASVVYGLAISFGLIGQTLPTTVAEQLANDVVWFQHSLKTRARKLQRHQLAAIVEPSAPRVYEEPKA